MSRSVQGRRQWVWVANQQKRPGSSGETAGVLSLGVELVWSGGSRRRPRDGIRRLPAGRTAMVSASGIGPSAAVPDTINRTGTESTSTTPPQMSRVHAPPSRRVVDDSYQQKHERQPRRTPEDRRPAAHRPEPLTRSPRLHHLGCRLHGAGDAEPAVNVRPVARDQCGLHDEQHDPWP